jgi:aryl-alcohol dehydrogenase-like predicted oxidoreductase
LYLISILIRAIPVYSQDEASEIFIGEWMEKRGIRDQLVITTKYSIDYKRGDKSIPMHHHVNFLGNNHKSMHISLKDSLRKLRTDYIDIFYVHWWDYETSVKEVMDNLHNLAAAGKVLYLVSLLLPCRRDSRFT